MHSSLFMIDHIVKKLQKEDLYINFKTTPSIPLTSQEQVHKYLLREAVLDLLDENNFRRMAPFPKHTSHTWKRTDSGVSVYDNGTRLQKFDEVGYLRTRPVIIRVATNKVSDIDTTIEKSLELSSELFVSPPDQIVFFSFSDVKGLNADALKSKQNVYCVDTKWRKGAMDGFVNQFYKHQRHIKVTQ